MLARTPSASLSLGLLALAMTTGGEVAGLPQHDGQPRLGVANCAGCHASPRTGGRTNVVLDEAIIWQKRDPHARAYLVLLEERSQEIARKLRLPDPAHRSPRCLTCHADYVPPELLPAGAAPAHYEDGVGCEACHGGGEPWLGRHASGRYTHEENVAAGMYPTDDPSARTALCLSCHLGTDEPDKFVGHELMGAGHPRMFFEVDTFSEEGWKHFRIDDDYRERKSAARWGAPLWAAGQALQAGLFLERLSAHLQGAGLFPELVFFDCHACHHPMSDRRWAPNELRPLRPGQARLNDSTLLMLEHVAAGVAPEQTPALREGVQALHAATAQGAGRTVQAAQALKAMTDRLARRALAEPFSSEGVEASLRSLAAAGARGSFNDRGGAEQSFMAMQSLMDTLARRGDLEPREALIEELQVACALLLEEERFDPGAFMQSAARMEAVLQGQSAPGGAPERERCESLLLGADAGGQ